MTREWAQEPPSPDAEVDPLTGLIRMQDGVIASWQARQFLTQNAIQHRVRTGRWRRLHLGVYHAYGGVLTADQRRWLAVLCMTSSSADLQRVFLGGLTALQVHGLRTINSPAIYVLRASAYRRKPATGTIVHLTAALPWEDRHGWRRPPITAPGRSVVDAAAWARSDDEARLIISASFQQRLVSHAQIAAVVDRMPEVRRRQLILGTGRDAANGSHSIGELDFLALCRKARLPLPDRQVAFTDEAGRMRFLDAVFDEWLIAVEIDGAQHDDVAIASDDAIRQNAAALDDYRILRFPVHMIRQQPQAAMDRLRSALIKRGWRP